MNRDFRELLFEFSRHGVEHLVIGAHALAAHGHVRATKDLDVWVRANAENARRVTSALASFGAPLAELSEADFATPGVDVCTDIDGVDFTAAWARRLAVKIDGLVISADDLIANERATRRLQGLADVEALERLRRPS